MDFRLFFIVLLCLSNLITGAFLLIKHRRYKELKASQKDRGLDKSATELLGEMMTGGAVIVTGVLDRDSIFQWSPRARQ